MGVYCEDFGENRPRYNGNALYLCLVSAGPAKLSPQAVVAVRHQATSAEAEKKPEKVSHKIMI